MGDEMRTEAYCADLEAEVERYRQALIDIHKLATEHREWAIAGRCVTELGPGVPGVSAPSGGEDPK